MADLTTNFILGWRNSFLKHWRVTQDYTIAIAGAMPSEHYGFKPAPKECSFAEQLVHLAWGNRLYMTVWTASPIPDRPNIQEKTEVEEYLSDSFQHVTDVVGGLDERDLLRQDLGVPHVPPHTGTDILLRAYMHTAHHRGQAVVYLRLKDIEPPDWAFIPTG
ncbi:MAG: DinB family protein [Acidobacteriaceae bacterium]|nr:DinB family protein [Acidobacteriaceae bacterium]MBV9779929.1 DinB family protein [Acidobacteriaceae bacterium]